MKTKLLKKIRSQYQLVPEHKRWKLSIPHCSPMVFRLEKDAIEARYHYIQYELSILKENDTKRKSVRAL